MCQCGKMTIKPLLIFLLILSSSLSGCLDSNSEKEEKIPFWPEKVDLGCLSDSEELDCNLYLDGFSTPIRTLQHPLVDEIWIADLNGTISSWNGDERREIGNVSHLISNCHNEQGLLSFAFAGNWYRGVNKLLLSYTEAENCEGQAQSNLTLAEVSISDGVMQLDTVKILREIFQPHRNHNGGHILAIGNDTFLWGIGDGGSRDDPDKNGQNESSPLGSIQYFQYLESGIEPILNHSEIRDENFMLHSGLRNPWRFDLDTENRLWIADVGQRCWEEVNLVEFGVRANFGWSEREGKHDFQSESECDNSTSETPEGFTDPVIEYPHGEECSISGGEWMNWGPKNISEGYLFGDFCSGQIWLSKQIEDSWHAEPILSVELLIVGFGRGLNDELLILTWTGAIYSITDK